MSTRSTIALAHTDEHGKVTYKAIYCHYDGYLEGVGKVLLRDYTDPDKVEQLIALGNISVLGKTIGTKHEFHHGPEDETDAYGRDREDPDQQATVCSSFSELLELHKQQWGEYLYVYDPKEREWYWYNEAFEQLRLLANAI